MKKLRRAILPFVHSIVLGDGGAPTPTLADLRSRLEQIVRDNGIYLRTCMVFTAMLFAIAAAVVLANLVQPIVVQVAFAAIVATTFGSIYIMRSLWREKVATEILLAMSDAFEGEALRTVVDTFARRLR